MCKQLSSYVHGRWKIKVDKSHLGHIGTINGNMSNNDYYLKNLFKII